VGEKPAVEKLELTAGKKKLSSKYGVCPPQRMKKRGGGKKGGRNRHERNPDRSTLTQKTKKNGHKRRLE